MTEGEEKKLSPIAVAAGAVASVLSMVVGSLLGDAGTLIGAAVGSVTYSAGAFVVEDRARRAHAKLKARKDTEKAAGDPGKHHIQAQMAKNPLGKRVLIYAKTEQELRRSWNPRRKLAMLTGMLLLCLVSAAGTLLLVEGATGKTLSSNLGGPAQYGTTLGGFTTHSPSPRPSVRVSSETPSATTSGSATASPSPDASPDAIPSPVYTGVSSGQ